MRYGTIKIYGEIWSWGRNSATEFTNRLNDLINDTEVDVINVRLHCNGGEVLEGNVIFNAIKASPKPVDIYVDGVSASMATIIMLAGRNIYMAQNAFLMIHAPSGGCFGNARDMAKCAKVLNAMEKNFKAVYTAKTGKTEAQIKDWFEGDNWFSAQEALDENLITGIVDNVAQVASVAESVLKTYSAKSMYQRYTALQETEKEPNKQPNANNQLDKKSMDKNLFIATFSLMGVTGESTDAEVLTAISTQFKALKDAKEKAESDLSKLLESQISEMVNAHATLTQPQKDAYVEIGKTAGVEALKTVLSALGKPVTITSQLGGGASSGASGDPKTFAELVALGEATLTEWKATRKDDYKRLYKAEYGHDISI